MSLAGSTVVFAVDMKSPHDGASRGEPSNVWSAGGEHGLDTATASAEWFGLRPGRDVSEHLQDWHKRAWPRQAAAVRLNGSPDFNMACMITASLRATATAARLKPNFSRSFKPQRRRSLSACARVRMTVAAS